MKKHSEQILSISIRIVVLLAVAASIGVTYYVHIIQKDYEILTNPDGPDTSDYFE